MNFLFEQAYLIIPNLGLAIILFSLILNIIVLPLYQFTDYLSKQEKNIQDFIKPEINLIKKHYTGNQQYYQVQAVYKRYKYHPIMALRSSSGLFLQAIVFFWAYKFLLNNSIFDNMSFGNIHSLNKPDALFGKINLLPFLMTGFNLLAIYFYNTSQSEKNKLYILALLFFVILYSSSSALIIYWTSSNFFAFIKNIFANKFKFLLLKAL